MTRDQASQLGRIQGDQRLAVVEAGLGQDPAVSYAAGMAASGRDYILKVCGHRAAYEFCAELADQIAEHMIAQANAKK